MAQPEVIDRPRVLVVDDDAALAEMLTLVLRNEGFVSQIVTRGDDAMSAFRAFRPDVVLLDLMLPGKDGIDVCREIRAESGVPIVMLTARSDTLDVVVGLESGADDYVVEAVQAQGAGRPDPRPGPPVRGADPGRPGDRRPDHRRRRPRGDAGEQPIALTPLEFDLLVCLAQHPRNVFSREVLLEQVWGYRHAADTRLVNVHVQRLRAKVERDPENPTGRRHGPGCRLQGGRGKEPASGD